MKNEKATEQEKHTDKTANPSSSADSAKKGNEKSGKGMTQERHASQHTEDGNDVLSGPGTDVRSKMGNEDDSQDHQPVKQKNHMGQQGEANKQSGADHQDKANHQSGAKWQGSADRDDRENQQGSGSQQIMGRDKDSKKQNHGRRDADK